MCRIKCEPKCLIYPCSLHLHYKRDTCTQLFFSEFCIILINTFLLDYSWASASGFIFDIFKSNKELKVSFLLPVFYRKSRIKPKNRVALKLGDLRFALYHRYFLEKFAKMDGCGRLLLNSPSGRFPRKHS